ncbi:DBR1-domain-containing protein [Dissophora ornata]|nr:DBR1-domain-containing protein [Dissophora ornata]
MRIAVEGCCHGQLDDIYRAIEDRERQHGYKVDLLLICGDFQSIRNEADLEAIACPRKYLHLGTFHKYYSGERKVPVPTVFIGGNHEASNYLWELYHGGWVCPGIYFLGFGGVINVGGLRIGGMSGIFNAKHYETGHFEVTPFNDNHKRSVYHVRHYDVLKMIQVKESMDVFLSHDWPLGIEQYGNVKWLLQTKRFFEKEVQNNTLGSPAYETVLSALRPAHWFSAHLHVRYPAEILWGDERTQHPQGASQSQSAAAQPPAVVLAAVKNPDEIEIDLDDEDGEENGGKTADAAVIEKIKNPDEIEIDDLDDEGENDSETPSSEEVNTTTEAKKPEAAASNPDEIQIEMDDESEGEDANGVSSKSKEEAPQQTSNFANAPSRPRPTSTKFLALDKCLPNRRFLEIIELPEIQCEGSPQFSYDEEWLAIVRTMDPFLSLEHRQRKALQGARLAHALEVNREWVKNNITLKRGLHIPENFQQTAPAHDAIQTMGLQEKRDATLPFLNPQTQEFCDMMQITNKINPYGRRAQE